ncbi:hypothetical protein BCO71033_04420 [Burkholderia contaminans]|uniref:Uncharacterized protein n=1 Tax=Burkholderia contaminans TaxID=488447 RepID=A0A6P2ZTV7_9BURK|nr:hypothetical protein BCO71033_04420 [Burkholderia contaminans]
MSTLSDQFTTRINDALAQCYALGYTPHRFEQMLRTYGGVGAARRLVVSSEIHEGLKSLKDLGRLDLSVEHIMLDPIFASLFTKSEKEASAWRLTQV